jgi:general secretion pathway protein H
MQILATGKNSKLYPPFTVRCKTPGDAAGFTLLEIMVVVVIIGILLSVFTLSVGSFSEDPGAEDAARLRTLVELASDEAAMQGREFGLTFYQHGYEFSWRQILVNEDGQRYIQWTPADGDRLLRARDLGEELSFDLDLGGEEIVLLYERDSEADYEPHIFLMSSGEIEPPFSARIRPTFQSQGYMLTADAFGKLDITNEAVDD